MFGCHTSNAKKKKKKIMATVHNKYLVKIEKAVNLRGEVMNRKPVLIESNVLHQKILNLYKDFRKRAPSMSDHIHIVFMTVCYSYSILLLVMINHYLCLMFKLNFLSSVCVYREKTVNTGCSTFHWAS